MPDHDSTLEILTELQRELAQDIMLCTTREQHVRATQRHLKLSALLTELRANQVE